MSQDRIADLQARVAELEARLREMERREEMSLDALVRKLLPEDVRTHMRAARKEQLLAIRSMLDHWIERSEETASGSPRRRESITVE